MIIDFAAWSPLGWDRVNLTGDYVWSNSPVYDADGLRPRSTAIRRRWRRETNVPVMSEMIGHDESTSAIVHSALYVASARESALVS
jgi:hypothetical protein